MRTSILILVIAAATALSPELAAAADAVPKFDIRANCKAEIAGGSGIGETLESCVNDEQQARDQLAQAWTQFSKADKTICIRETSVDGTPSYVELQTCLEMSADAKARLGDRK
ncbi:MAG TPA: hypothetical protein VFB02_16210 [Bradyrhizobium sp.]|nr:hypothetical protein [Bradyrhizobium sp.]